MVTTVVVGVFVYKNHEDDTRCKPRVTKVALQRMSREVVQ